MLCKLVIGNYAMVISVCEVRIGWLLVCNAVLVDTVSQFTLYGILKGNKPDFHVAMPPQKAKPFYEALVDKFQKSYNSDAIKGKLIFPLQLYLSNDMMLRIEERPLSC